MFEDVPELYDRVRPVYPGQLFDDLKSLASLPARARVLEIGPGTGQATLRLAQAGYEVVGVELGKGLASVARQKLAVYPKVQIVIAPFETWEAGERRFDAVVAFTAFHWIDPEVRFRKSAELLVPGGSLAVVSTQHVLPQGGDTFWASVQQDYDAVDPRDDNRPPPPSEEVDDLSREIEASGYFHSGASRRYLWDVDYTADEYISVIDTYSGHRSLELKKRQELYDRIRRRIESRPDRKVTKTYLAILDVARKR